ncbi:MAG: glycosidase [Bacteroidetes bacterium]|nr:MAG: glycosidase [Bacteroidota bacterium]
MKNNFPFDKIIITPDDIDLYYSPIKKDIGVDTFVLGAFNPGMAKLPNGNIILMIRIAEALKTPIVDDKIHSIRWDSEKGYVLDAYNINDVDTSDPRSFTLKEYYPMQVDALTSISWLLPVELTSDGAEIVTIHYNKIISPAKSYQEYGIEDARISQINGKYYMTTCSVSSEKLGTTLYTSENGLDYTLEGVVLDHQNKDMLFFEGLINNKFYALTRPMGGIYFATHSQSKYSPGPSINLAESPDSLHWKPLDEPFIRPGKSKATSLKLGGGAQPILTPKGWLVLFHGVEKNNEIGVYRTYWALLDKNEPWKILHLDMVNPVLIANPNLTNQLLNSIYIEDVVFTTGILEYNDVYILASGELDLCSRITHIPKSRFNI